MELIQYWQIIRRRWIFALAPIVFVGLLGVGIVVRQSDALPYYTVQMNFIVGQVPLDTTAQAEEDRYYTWLTSEYIVSGVTDWVNGTAYAEHVSSALADAGVALPAGAVAASLSAEAIRSRMTLSIGHPDRKTLAALTQAALQVLENENGDALPQLGGVAAGIYPVDEVIINEVPGSTSRFIDIRILPFIGIALGLGLAFLVEYIDPRIRSRAEVEAIDLPVFGEIPKS